MMVLVMVHVRGDGVVGQMRLQRRRHGGEMRVPRRLVCGHELRSLGMLRVVQQPRRGADVVRQAVLEFILDGIVMIEPAVGSHDGRFCFAEDLVRADDHWLLVAFGGLFDLEDAVHPHPFAGAALELS